MSARQVLKTVDEMAADAAVGFVITLAALIAADPPPVGVALRSETEISRRRPQGQMKPATSPQLSFNVTGATTTAVQPPFQRDGRVRITARYEVTEADENNLEYQVAYAAAALSKMFVENLRAYSDAHGGTVVEIEDPIQFSFGQFEGPVADGFLAEITIIERSTE